MLRFMQIAIEFEQESELLLRRLLDRQRRRRQLRPQLAALQRLIHVQLVSRTTLRRIQVPQRLESQRFPLLGHVRVLCRRRLRLRDARHIQRHQEQH